MSAKQTGGQALIAALKAHHVDTIFCVAGESYLAALDALVDAPDIKVVTCRQEGGAAFMAESYAKISGKPGICFVTRGPGACNASIGVHTAKQDSTPMILLVGQIARDCFGREAFQEIDYNAMFGTVAKDTQTIMHANDAQSVIDSAFHTAMDGRKGPVVIDLPEDMLREAVSEPKAPFVKPDPSERPVSLTQAQITDIASKLSSAEKPLIIVGGGNGSDALSATLQKLAAKWDIPVCAAFRRQDMMDHNDPCYIGELGTGPNPTLVSYAKDSDCIIALGARLGEITTQEYSLFDIPKPKQMLIHIHPDETELGRVYHANNAVCMEELNFVKDALNHIDLDETKKEARAAWREKGRDTYERWTNIEDAQENTEFSFDMNIAYQAFLKHMPKNAIITTDAGNFSGWAQRYIRYGRIAQDGRSMRLAAPTSGAMGYGLPALIGANYASSYQDETSYVPIALMGDGGFMMSGQELATIKAENLRGIAMIFDNGIYGTIRMHQERDYPHRHMATDLVNPDFVALAQSYGLKASLIDHHAAFENMFLDAVKTAQSGGFTLLHIKNDPEQITTGKTMSIIRGE